jgi:hypothetical protein
MIANFLFFWVICAYVNGQLLRLTAGVWQVENIVKEFVLLLHLLKVSTGLL